jgi:hypothetical protein
MGTRSVELLASAADTTGRTSADQTNRTGRGVVVCVKKTANSGTSPTVTVTIQGKDRNGDYYTILASAAISSNGSTYYRVYPGLTAAANATVNDVLPRVWRVSTAIGGSATPSCTYNVTADVLD